MKMKEENDWSADDATWKLLGEATPTRAGARFADDVVRSVKLLPDGDSWWSRAVSLSPWVGVAACVALAAFLFLNGPEAGVEGESLVVVGGAEGKWSEIEEFADTEMLAAVADHPDSFSDQELVSLIGF